MEHFKLDNLLTNQAQPQHCDSRTNAEWIAKRIALVLAAYRKDDYSNPELFVGQVAANLELFPPEVVEYVTAPTTGIQTRSNWPPTLAEMVEACKAEMAWREKMARHSERGQPAKQLPLPKFSVEQSYSAMVEKYGRPFGPFEAGRELPYGKMR